tara:strand:- start:19231 stop:19695 length:465 start_codon:yes stop_codon:yes gene_type:complete
MEIKTDINTLEVTNFLKKLTRTQKSVIDKGLKRVSNMAILMLTKRTQAGKLPDGGNMRAYAKGTVRSRKKRGRQTGFVDLTDTGKMFRSLDFRTGRLKSTLFFANKEREKIASYHDSLGVGRKKITRPFFAIGKKEEDKIQAEFSKFYFKQMRI